MPKVDRCALLKKESQATRKRLVGEQRQAQRDQEKIDKERAKAEEERIAAERAKARQAGPSKFEQAMKAGQGSSTFNKAVAVVDDESGEEYAEEEVTPTNGHGLSNGASQPKKESATSKKKAAAERHKQEMDFLASEQKAARRRRVLDRLLRLFVVGFVIDAFRDRGQRPVVKDTSKVKKKGNKANADSEPWSLTRLWDAANIFTGPVVMLLFTVFLGFLVIAGEDFDPHSMQASGVNLYEVLGVQSDADVLQIRKAYKNLAITWHPDKNPGCEACAARFAKIGEAYEILNSPDKKKAYDQRRAPEGSLESVASVDLTAEDFESRVLRSNDVWFVQVYESNNGASKDFHPMWEDCAQKQEHLARFGRIDVTKQRRALRFMPQRVILFPVVFKFARGQEPELFQPDFNREERSNNPLIRWVIDRIPLAPVLAQPDDLKAWWNAPASRPRILIAGPVGQQKSARGGWSREFLQAQRSAFVWAEFFDVAFSEQQTAEAALGDTVLAKGYSTGKAGKGAAWSIALQRLSGTVEKRKATTIKKLVPQLEDLFPKALGDLAPQLTARNYQQLCGMHHSTRTYCLVLVDAPDARVMSALSELNDSKASYTQEVTEMQSSGEASEEAPEELFHIQPVRVSTSSSRLPWQPVGAGSGFRAVWAETEQAPAFLFEAETRRLGAVRTASYRELFQQIAYDDLKFQELPEQTPFSRGLPDPEVPLVRELQHALATPVGAIGAWVFAACAIAILPELSVVAVGAFAVSVATVLLACWPLATRRLVSFFWCTSSSSFECQVGA